MARREERKKRITRQRQEQILNAALQVFSRRGFNGATIPDIAREAGIAVGTIYNYYRNKRTLLIAIMVKFFIEPFTEITRQAPAEDDRALISAVMENRLDFVLGGGVEKMLPLLGDIQRDNDLRKVYVELALRPIMEMMGNYYTSRIKEGAFRDVNPAIITRAIGGMVVGFMFLYGIEGEKSPIYGIDRKKLANELTELVLKGLQR